MSFDGIESLLFSKEEIEKAAVTWEERWLQQSNWKESFALLPHRCHLTKKLIWMKMGYRGALKYFGTRRSYTEVRWHHYDEHIVWELTRYK